MPSDLKIHILGCGSALPTTRHLSSSQVVSSRERLYMIDCCEGAQLQMRRMKLKLSRLNHIFISHIHGDHCFGLPGLISTLGLLGRANDLFIYAPKELEEFLHTILELFNRGLSYKVSFKAIDPVRRDLIMEDSALKVYTIPLKHRVPACGFLFEEKEKDRSLIREAADFYNVPLGMFARIKKGEDFTTSEGEVVPNARLTRPSSPPARYAYCSDTSFFPDMTPQIKGVNLLYHEATFSKANVLLAKKNGHSTAAEAAEIARRAEVGKLVIGHFSTRYINEQVLLDEAKAVFEPTFLANEGMVIPVQDGFSTLWQSVQARRTTPGQSAQQARP